MWGGAGSEAAGGLGMRETDGGCCCPYLCCHLLNKVMDEMGSAAGQLGAAAVVRDLGAGEGGEQLIEQDGNFSTLEMQGFEPVPIIFSPDDLLLFSSGLHDSLLATLGFQEGHLPVRYLGLPLISARLYVADCQPLLQKIDNRIKDTSSSGYPKVAWEAVCRPIEEGGLGIKDILALNRALMSKHLWAVIKQNRTSIWVDWIIHIRLRDCSIWTVKDNKGAWGWRKMLSLRHSLVSQIHFCVGNGDSISLWHDPWHPLVPLISRFPRGPQLTNTGLLDKLSVVIKDGQWNWPMITDIACLEITYMLPPISVGPDRIS
ncbi:hypothetical protein Sango_3091900 [Sesamum angolense]|uniref:Uncharacterized protein n=1 Tax=Sesamum angolense TaxID=2727404 RepID=A0AAE1T9U4_9LAMI|nr:hypothetical protein Sango_3091900 [Sesamum angolense]